LSMMERKHDDAIRHAKLGVELAPGSADANNIGGSAMIYSGDPATGVELMRIGMRLEPDYPHWVASDLAAGLSMLGRLEEAKEVSLGILASDSEYAPSDRRALSGLASIAMKQGDQNKAKYYIEKLLEVSPNENVSMLKRRAYFLKDQKYVEGYISSLRQAGLPEQPPSTKPTKPSIAVLPFANLSDDKEQEYFADGMTDDLITDLSKVSGLIVIARNSVFTYKGKNVKVQEVAKDLNVTHVLEGSVRRAGDQVRINAQLIDANTGEHLWAERYVRDLADIFRLQDEVLGKITTALRIKLAANTLTRSTSDLRAYDFYLKAREAHYQYDFTGEEFKRALKYYEQAVNADPGFAEAYAGQSAAWAFVWTSGLIGVASAPEAKRQAEISAERALALDPGNTEAIHVQAQLLAKVKKNDQALKLLDKALSLNPNHPSLLYTKAWVLSRLGRNQMALETLQSALRIDPKPRRFNAWTASLLHYHSHKYERALEFANVMIKGAPKSLVGYDAAIVSAAQGGDLAAAHRALEARLKIYPPTNILLIKTFNAGMHPDNLKHFLNGFRKAGVPETPFGFTGEGMVRLNDEEIRDAFFGRRHEGSGRNSGPVKMEMDTEGRWKNKIGPFNHTGTAEVRDSKFCITNSRATLGRTYCMAVFRNPNGTKQEKNEIVWYSIYDVYSVSIVD
jgi:adenylate cyclase